MHRGDDGTHEHRERSYCCDRILALNALARRQPGVTSNETKREGKFVNGGGQEHRGHGQSDKPQLALDGLAIPTGWHELPVSPLT